MNRQTTLFTTGFLAMIAFMAMPCLGLELEVSFSPEVESELIDGRVILMLSTNDDDGYPQRLWDRRTGAIDPEVAAYWRENYDLRHILERDWEDLGPKLVGKIHILTGDMDNYYLNNAVYLTEKFLESTTDPYYAGIVDYSDRAEHCWNGDHDNPNHISRLRYNTMYLPRILERIESTAPEGADLTSWRY